MLLLRAYNCYLNCFKKLRNKKIIEKEFLFRARTKPEKKSNREHKRSHKDESHKRDERVTSINHNKRNYCCGFSTAVCYPVRRVPILL